MEGESGERKSRARGEGEMCGGGGGGGRREEGRKKKKCCFLLCFSLHEPQLLCPQCSCLQSSLRFDRFQHSTVLTAVLAGTRTDQLRASTDTLFKFSLHSQ